MKIVKEARKRTLICLLITGLIFGIMGICANTATAQRENKISTSQWSTWTDYYDACNSEMKTTFSYTWGFPGTPQVLCIVDNTPFYREYDHYICPGYSGVKVEWTHCTNLSNHRLLMDFQPTIDTPGFIDPCSFKAEYFASQQQ